MACMAQSLAELLHTVSIHNDSVPSDRHTHTPKLCMLYKELYMYDYSGKDKEMNDNVSFMLIT